MLFPFSYRYYSVYFIPFFFILQYPYSNAQSFPKIFKLQYEVNILYGNSNFAFLKNLALLVFNFLKIPQKMSRNRNVPIYQWHFLFNYTRPFQSSYVRFVSTTMARLKKAPLVKMFQANNYYMFTVPNYYTMESYYFELNLYEQIFSGFIVFRFKLSPTPFNLGVESQNFLRSLNVPLERRLAF